MRILFVTSNGTGLGHLTRSMAIARRLEGALEPRFVTFSAAAPVVAGLGFPVEYIASYDRPGAGNDLTWTWRSRARLEALVAEQRPRIVVFDGTHPYERLLPALRSDGAVLVWCRRAMWRRESDTAPLHRSHLFDAILEPGELAANADAGPTVARRSEAHRVDPVVLLDRSELLTREEAERELGLEPDRVTALVQLGQGAGVREANERCLAHLAARADVQVAALASTLESLAEVPDGVVRLRATYPISRYLAAFDLAVAAAGYNAYHELIHLGVPALYVPMPRQTDDQPARARYAESENLGISTTGPDDPALEQKLDLLLDQETRERLSDRLSSLNPSNGAAEAAQWLTGLASGRDPAAPDPNGAGKGVSEKPDYRAGSRRRPPSRPPAKARRKTLRQRWIFVKSIPRTALRITTQALTRPKPRTVILAFNLDADELAARLAQTLDDLGEWPERTLVITDGLDFAPLLAAGVGFEHVPSAGAEGSGEARAAERMALVCARRPRPRRLIALGEVPAAIREAARRRLRPRSAI